ncbi:MAG: DUF2868 domain-containing protein [Gammaproteobacteria bacterium]|jgi:hypothetical protein
MTHASLLADLIDLQTALQADGAISLEDRKPRDRNIGKALQRYRSHPARQLHGWLERVEISGWKRDGHEGAQLYHVLCLMLVVLGQAAGWGLARAVLHYTGDAPINIVHALGLLVLPQIVLLFLWIVSTVPWRIPLFGSLQSALRFLNPGRLARRLARLFPRHARRNLEMVWDTDNAVVLAPAARWLFSFWSQLFAFWFNVGVLLAVFYLISFSDLAFAWSTTLSLDNATFHRMLGAFTWPWQSLFPDAVPSRELIEISRYYRLESGALDQGAASTGVAARLGQWWPFLIAAIVSYGLLPRLLTLVISWFRFRHHLGRALPRLPGAPELLARMNFPLITTSAASPEIGSAAAAGPESDLGHLSGAGIQCRIVEWSGSTGGSEAVVARLHALGIVPLAFFKAGGSCSTGEDKATVAALCGDAGEGVAIIAKSWEPPLLEFLDFVQDVRNGCRRGEPIIVLLWGGQAAVSETDRDTWRLTLRRLKDPDLHLEVLGSEA